MIDRWSYDPRTDELDVWDSENNRIQHYHRCGEDGYLNCSQGRLLGATVVSIYGNRPYAFSEEEKYYSRNIREAAKKKVEEYLGHSAIFTEVF